MRAMKDSGIEWIGQIPQEWSTVKVKFTGNYQSGNSITASAIKERGEFPVYGGNGLRGYTDHFTHNGSHILIGRQGALCGNVHLVNGMFWASEHAVVGKIADNYNIRYIYYLLDVFNLNRLSTTAAQPGISVEQIVNVIIPKPPKKSIQLHIADFLDTKCAEIDALIAAKEKTNALLKERRQSIIYEAVTKGLNPDAPMKDSGIEWIGQIPQEWDVISIKHLRNGDDNSFEDGDWIEAPYISDAGIRYLTTGNIGDGTYKEQGNGFVTQETFNALKCKYAYPGDLVFSRLNAPYGRTCILPNFYPEYVLAVDNVILRTDHCKEFLCYLTQCAGYQRMVEEKANGTTMKRISRTNLGDIALPIPTLAEQKAISKYLKTECAATDAVIFTNEVTIQKLKEYRQSIIYEAVTGKIEV